MLIAKNHVVPKALALLALVLSIPLAQAADEDAAPVPVSAYVENLNLPALVDDPSIYDPTVAELQTYLEEKHSAGMKADGFNQLKLGIEDYRIQSVAPAVGLIVIKVHKSTNPAHAEYLEIFKMQSNDANDLAPINLFDNGTSNRALVSTAGTYNGKVYGTPVGDFKIDSLEVMHHSAAYNNAPMPWTMFFNGGIAIHAAIGSEIAHLGQKASHGCVRTHPVTAKALFDFVSNGNKKNVVIEVLNS